MFLVCSLRRRHLKVVSLFRLQVLCLIQHWAHYCRFIILKPTGPFFRIMGRLVKMSWKMGSFSKLHKMLCISGLSNCPWLHCFIQILCRCWWWKTYCSWCWTIWRPWMRVLSSRSFVHSYSSLNKLLNHLTFNPKGLAQVVKVLDFGGITIRSKVRIPLGANISLGPHFEWKLDLIDLCGGGYITRVQGLSFRGGPSLKKKKNPSY